MIQKSWFIVLFVSMLLFQFYTIQGIAEEDVLPVDIPEYEVTSVDGYDQVLIPDGRILCIPGNPIVPYFIIYQWYPSNFEIQNVSLLERSGLKTESDLNLEICKLQWGSSSTNDSSSFNTTQEWYPLQKYAWTVDDEGNDTTKLSLLVFPFFYNASSHESRFYTSYQFLIESITSTVTITSLSLDTYTVHSGEDVTVHIGLTNTEQPRDVIVSAQIKQNEQSVGQLPFRELTDFQGYGDVSLTWETDTVEWGLYECSVELFDSNGFILDRDVISFSVGIPQVNVTSLQVDPAAFTIGETVDISAEIQNMGDVMMSGVFVAEIHSSEDIIKSFRYPFENLSSGATTTFQGVWDSSSIVSNETYFLLGYVTYGGDASQPVQTPLTVEAKGVETPGFEFLVLFVALGISVRRFTKT